jgi:hypothetical protein
MEKKFCKNCGQSIDSSSRFCSYCGTNVEDSNDSISTKNSDPNQKVAIQDSKTTESVNENRVLGIPKGLFIILSLWIILNFIFLIINLGSGDVDRFWPFFDEYGKSYVEFSDYDYSEFLVYIFVPLALALLYSFVFRKRKSV